MSDATEDSLALTITFASTIEAMLIRYRQDLLGLGAPEVDLIALEKARELVNDSQVYLVSFRQKIIGKIRNKALRKS